MAFFLLIIYQFFLLLRPLEWRASFSVDDPALPFTILFLAASAAFMFYSRKTKKVYCTQFWLTIAMGSVIFMSASLNLWLGLALQQLQLFTLVAIVPLLLYTNLASSNQKIEIIMFTCVISALLMLSHGISQIAATDGIGWAGSTISEGSRITYLGILEDPNDLGGFFVLCLPFAAYFFSTGKNILTRLFGMTSTLSLLYGIYLTNSRGALLATFAIFGSYFLYRYGKAKTIIFGIFSLPVLAIVASVFRAIDSEESSASDRVDAWYTGFQLFFSSPILGVGFEQFGEYSNITAHNSFILVMSELGVLGYGLWFSLIGLSFFMMLKILKHYQQLQIENNFESDSKETELSKAYAINSTLFFSMIGYMSTIFFLSRSYHFLTFFTCALAVASYNHITSLEPSLKFQDIKPEVRKLFALSLASILALNVVVKVFI